MSNETKLSDHPLTSFQKPGSGNMPGRSSQGWLTDDVIIAALTKWGSDAMTYVAANVLRSEGFKISTAQVRRHLMRLEREGRVERVSSPYLVQICWRPIPHTPRGVSLT